MKRKSIPLNYYQHKIYVRFYHLQKKLRSLIHSGEFFTYSVERRNQMIRRLTILYERLKKLLGKQKLKWAVASFAMILSASAVKAGFNEPVSLSGFRMPPGESYVTFADVDRDGDKDIVIGNYDGTLSYIQNNNGSYEEISPSLSPIDTSVHVSHLAAPALADIDGSGYLDLAVGDTSGKIFFFRYNAQVKKYQLQTGSYNPFHSIDVGKDSRPEFVDLDNDGDMDLVVGNYSGTLHYFRNDGGKFTEMTGSENPFSSLSFGRDPGFTFVDYDHDGDFDLFVGSFKYDSLSYYKNNGGTFALQTGSNNPFHGLSVGWYPSPNVLDISGDHKLDLVVGSAGVSYLEYFKNDNGAYTEQRGTFNPFEGIMNSDSAAPAFADLDNDGDEDLVLGDKYGKLKYYQNVGNGFVPVADSLSPFDSITAGIDAKPVFVDLDNDHDSDLVVGSYDGTIHYYQNDAGKFVEKTGTDNPFNGISVGYDAAPAFYDVDHDGDLDLVVGDKYGKIHYFQNNNGTYVEQTGANNPFDSIDVGFAATPAFADLDYDGDLDLFVGNKYGTVSYYQNNGGVFTQKTGIDNPLNRIHDYTDLAPAFADINKDGHTDLYFGDAYGKVYFSQFMSPGITVDAGAGIKTSESGGSSVFTIVLKSQPVDNVEINISSSDLTEGTVNPMNVLFTSQNWNKPQLVTVTGVNDNLVDGNINYQIDFTVTSSDADYYGVTIPSLPAVNADNNGPSAINSATANAIKVTSFDKTIRLNMGDNLVRKVEVYGIDGSLLVSREINSTGQYELPVDNASGGIYLVRVYTDNNVTTTKVMLR